jgi:hypothetical protein
MSADRLLEKLDGVKRAGPDRWIAKCPAHGDRRASLSVRELDDGRVLVHDFAGCGVEEVLGAVGLTFDDLYPERPTDHRKPRERKPYSVRDLVRALDFELLVASVILIDIAAGKTLSDEDRARAATAQRRIEKFMRELQHA